MPTPSPVFLYTETSCSQCGSTFGPGNHGFSHCQAHRTHDPATCRYCLNAYIDIAPPMTMATAEYSYAIWMDSALHKWRITETIPRTTYHYTYLSTYDTAEDAARRLATLLVGANR